MLKLANVFLFCLAQSAFLASTYVAAAEPQCSCSDYSIVERIILIELEALKFKQAMEQEIAALKQINNQFQTKLRAMSKTAGDTYARWGRTTCPGNGTSRLYTGYMAGSHRSYTGTGSNYLCLTNEPLWDHFEESVASLGKITGTEYRFNEHRSNGAADFLGDYMYNQKVPCAICHTQRSVSVMIPGRNRCYDGWTIEYRGYLVSGYTGDKSATEYVCLDRRPEKLHDGTTAGTDNRLYFVEGICGKTLTCPPYVSGLEITCVVCSI